MIRILHLADLHLGWTPRFLDPVAANMRREARDRLLDRAVAYACDPAHGIDLVVVAGDLFESHEPDSTLIGRATAALRRLPMPLVTTPGNHDEITYASSVYRRTPWPGVLVTTPGPSRVATLRIRDETVHLYSLAYTGGVTSVRPSIRSFPRGSEEGLHIAVFHGSLGPWGGDRSLPLDLDALRVAAYDYVALGHIHKHEVHRLGEALAVYPGMIEGKGFDDPGVGHFTIAEVERGASRVWTAPCETWPVRVCPLDVTGLRAEEVEEAILRQTDDRLSLRVTLTGARSFALDPEQLRSGLGAAFFHLEVDDQTLPVDETRVDLWAREDTVLGLFVRALQARIAEADERRRPVLVQALHRGVHALRESGGQR